MKETETVEVDLLSNIYTYIRRSHSRRMQTEETMH